MRLKLRLDGSGLYGTRDDSAKHSAMTELHTSAYASIATRVIGAASILRHHWESLHISPCFTLDECLTWPVRTCQMVLC